tara:strand:+ start:401 stop:502 length:102 start_codon:yes stop_codon:yes gene_type:complete
MADTSIDALASHNGAGVSDEEVVGESSVHGQMR